MQIDNMTNGFFALWGAGDLEKAAGTDKLHYRVIGAYKFQFRKVDYKQRTALSIEVMAALKALLPILGRLQTIEPGTEDADAALEQQFLDAMPELIGALATPGLQGLIDRLCATAYCDVGNGTFEPLSNEVTGEKAFGADITLQIPVAATAAMVNLDTLFAKAQAAMNAV
jgi:hypothetical protein